MSVEPLEQLSNGLNASGIPCKLLRDEFGEFAELILDADLLPKEGMKLVLRIKLSDDNLKILGVQHTYSLREIAKKKSFEDILCDLPDDFDHLLATVSFPLDESRNEEGLINARVEKWVADYRATLLIPDFDQSSLAFLISGLRFFAKEVASSMNKLHS